MRVPAMTAGHENAARLRRQAPRLHRELTAAVAASKPGSAEYAFLRARLATLETAARQLTPR